LFCIQWTLYAKQSGVDSEDLEACNSSQVCEAMLERVARLISAFPGYARIRRVHCQLEPWRIDDGLITPTLKLKRNKVCERFAQQIEDMYKNH